MKSGLGLQRLQKHSYAGIVVLHIRTGFEDTKERVVDCEEPWVQFAAWAGFSTHFYPWNAHPSH